MNDHHDHENPSRTGRADSTRSGAGQPDGPRLLVEYSDDYVDTGEGFDTLSKASHVAELLEGDPRVELVEPTPATLSELTAVHDPDYVDAVRTGTPEELATSNGLAWDDRLFTAVSSSTGGMRDAALTALVDGVSGTLSSGLHHARRDQGRGYATFNGLVVAARAALAAGAHRVLILDLDAHAGGGTAELIAGLDGVVQLDVSVYHYDTYCDRPDAHLVVTGASEYLSTIEAELSDWQGGPVDLVLYNAGMDAHERAGGVAGITTEVIRQREQMVFDWVDSIAAPIAFTLAGGYRSSGFDLHDVAALHRLTVDAAVSHRCGA